MQQITSGNEYIHKSVTWVITWAKSSRLNNSENDILVDLSKFYCIDRVVSLTLILQKEEEQSFNRF